MRVVLLLKTGRYDAAIGFINKQVAVPQEQLRYELAYSYYRSGRLQEALQEMEQTSADQSRRDLVLLSQIVRFFFFCVCVCVCVRVFLLWLLLLFVCFVFPNRQTCGTRE